MRNSNQPASPFVEANQLTFCRIRPRAPQHASPEGNVLYSRRITSLVPALPAADKRLNEIFEKEALFMRNTLKALTTRVVSVTMTAGMAQNKECSGGIPKASR